jgi:Na+-transporting NADH:ubiquinone oxidoreductase subunit NqrE
MGDLVSLAVKAIFVENLALSFFSWNVYFHSRLKENSHSYWFGHIGYGSSGYYSAS